MAHKVNALVFRLGTNRKWISSWIEQSALYLKYLYNDFLIIDLLNYFLQNIQAIKQLPKNNKNTSHKKK